MSSSGGRAATAYSQISVMHSAPRQSVTNQRTEARGDAMDALQMVAQQQQPSKQAGQSEGEGSDCCVKSVEQERSELDGLVGKASL